MRAGINILWFALRRVASRKWLVVKACALLTLLGCVAISSIRGHDPNPEIHDENAYLLAADTFAHGRLTNPPHELWRSFETFHVLQRPTYQAKYPPGQGLFLALGAALSGRPLLGVFISASLLAGAFCWVLQAWVPLRWALVGSLLGMVTMILAGVPLVGGPVAYWSQSYWGGAVAALGGALLLGGVRRVVTKPHWGTSLTAAAGASILALSRPYEGLLLTIPVGAMLLWWLLRSRDASPAQKLTQVILPGGVAVACGLAWLAYYNHEVTGSALRFPYVEYHNQYQTMPLLTWQQPRPEPGGLNPEMLQYARWEMRTGEMLSSPGRRLVDMYRLITFEAGLMLAPVMLLLLPWMVRQRWMAFAVAAWLFVLLGMWMSSYFEVHYHAPAAALTLILTTAALRRITLIRKGPRVLWRSLVVLLCIATLGVAVGQWVTFVRFPLRSMERWAASRQEVIRTLTEQGGKHVVFVRYGPEHQHHIELVYNEADIDESKVVWARELEAEQNAKVLSYYSDRKAWLMLIPSDRTPATVVPLTRQPQ